MKKKLDISKKKRERERESHYHSVTSYVVQSHTHFNTHPLLCSAVTHSFFSLPVTLSVTQCPKTHLLTTVHSIIPVLAASLHLPLVLTSFRFQIKKIYGALIVRV